jgi:hypothetical protein
LLDQLNQQGDLQVTNLYILIAIDYATKWVKAKPLWKNIVVVTINFLYEYILTRFGFLLVLIMDQGVHFINDIIKHLTDHFLLKHVSSTTYYPQGNGHAHSTNKFILNHIIMLINENKTYWDEHRPIVFFSYKMYKVTKV